MKAERAVLDTNVLISAALSSASIPARVTFWFIEHGRLLFCRETFEELETRLWRPKFDRYLSIESRRLLLHDLSAIGEWIELPASTGESLSRDPDDDKFIYLASAGKADWLISGDQDLLELTSPEGLRILSPAAALAMLQRSVED